ncbi:threonine ammonia-lyase, biosynthetic [Candidatus Marinamargulisbacteria bacterium SCGC AG-410-N11]|nr:threonine ammonia-lyase, biosynthetic [Candidatus Marinamargulisbacteria bacterium SCGC AG-410-N11]
MLEKYLINILKSQVYDIAIKTPLELAPKLSKRFKNNILFKREDLQPVFSFKIRGAYNKLCKLTDAQKKSGVIASSAGNHAQGVALSAHKLGIKATIVMPKTTPKIKVTAVKQLGAKVVLHGDTYDDAFDYAQELSKSKDLFFIHPYDDVDVISGQGTIAKEILEQYTKTIDYIFVAIGGGGLVAGILAYIKSINPKIKIIGVEPENAACMSMAIKHKKRVILDQIGIFADGVAVRQAGKLPYDIASKYIDDIVLVDTDEICASIKDIFEENRSITEPAGALSLAGLKKYVEKKSLTDKTLITINCGANLNFDRLRHIAERANIGEQTEFICCVEIDERPGSFMTFCNIIGKRSITEFNYRYSSDDKAYIFVGIGLENGLIDKQEIMTSLKDNHYKVSDLSDNELAKLHIRHMVGGKSSSTKNERVLRIQFPERPGALLHFLKLLGKRWNISLFHYRNHGAAYGRVLLGIQIEDDQFSDLTELLDSIQFTYFDESKNPAVGFFL